MGEDGSRVPSLRGSSLWRTPSRDDERRAVSCWLAQAHPAPHQVHEEWLHHGVALLPLGRRFDAIRVPAARIHAALGTDDPATVTADLADRLHCPRSHVGPACSEGTRLRKAWTATQWASLRVRSLPIGEDASNT